MSDLRIGLRFLTREPLMTALAVLTAGLGIGATTILFSVANGVLLKPLPWREPERLVRVSETREGRPARVPGTLTNSTYLAWQDSPSTIEAIGGWMINRATLEGAGDPVRVATASVTPSLFGLLGVRPLLGRPFDTDDGPSGRNFDARSVAMVAHGLWHERFDGSDDVVGRSIRLDGKRMTIVGVMPEGFVFPDRETRIWTPFAVGKLMGDGAIRLAVFSSLARLRPGVTPAQAASEATARARTAPSPGVTAMAMFGSAAPPDVAVVRAADAMTADVRPAILILFGAVCLLLATAAANVANIQLARALARRREFAVRSALGAGSARIVAQLLVENLFVGGAAGAVGVAMAIAFRHVAPSLLPPDFPRVDDIAIDARVLLFAAGLSMLTSLAFGMIPALQAGRLNLVSTLGDDGGSPVGWELRTTATRSRALILAMQIALASTLLVGSGLLTRSLHAQLIADRGYDAANVLTAQLGLQGPRFTHARRVAVANEVLDRLERRPGIIAAGVASGLPLTRGTGGTAAFRLRLPDGREIDARASLRMVSPGYFSAMRVRLLDGRLLTDADTMTSPPVALVNRTFARQYLEHRALGTRLPIWLAKGRENPRIVGVVDDVRQHDVRDTPDPEVILSFRQAENRSFDAMFVLRTEGNPLALADELTAIVRSIDPSFALDSVMTMEGRVSASLARPRVYAVILAGFALAAAIIAAAGLFGVLSYGVAQRSREIGVRTALGARRADIVRLVTLQAARMTGAGIVVGLGVAALLVRSLSALLYGVDPHDALTFTLVPVIVLSASALACAIPAHRAASIDPMIALKRR